MERFRDRVVVVTAAASGIGQAMSELFAAEGAKVVGARPVSQPESRSTR